MNIIPILIGVVGAAFIGIVVAYFIILNKMKGKETKYVASLVEGTKSGSFFNMEIFYQKFYVRCMKIPGLRRYTLKLRRRLEIINLEDEYLTRKQSAQIMLKASIIFVIVLVGIIMLTRTNFMLMSTLILFEIVLMETIISGMVDKIDNDILREQIDFFAEIRHAYHEYNMVEEAIYEVSQNDEYKVSRQGEKIYEILISDDPEMELEKYYDIAPNSFLKEFAGVSYLTKEFGDRKDKDGSSLYLKNLNNITQEMQIEILKRDKLDYVFQSLSIIASVPILFLEVVKNWSVGQFSFTSQFYNGTLGFLAQVGIIILTYICYILVRKLKDNGSVNQAKNMEHPWQEKVYNNKLGKKIVDMFLPKDGSKEYRNVVQLLKDSASPLKIEWLYVNRLTFAIVAFIVTLIVVIIAHKFTINYQLTEPTSDYNLLGQMNDSQQKKAMQVTEDDNVVILAVKDNLDITEQELKEAILESEPYSGISDEELDKVYERIYTKLKIVQSAYLKWFEVLVSLAIGVMGYYGPIWMLKFQKKMRQMEMENEVMQYQTIILMLMKIERVNVEIILEWLERYSNIFREPISRCVNNFESGPWEALEELRQEISFQQLIRIVEGLQAAVEQIPIREAFDELDTERNYHQEKRKETNERLISRKSMIGKVIGFAPMVILFVGYLIIPLVGIGMFAMTDAFDTMQAQM